MAIANRSLIAIFFFCSLVIQPLSITPGHAKDLSGIFAATRIVYAHGKKAHSNLFSIKPDGSDRRQLTDSRAQDWEPVWSPDGAFITFQSYRDGNFELYRMRFDGTEQTRLTNHPAKDKRSTWSPDGSRICFQSYRIGHWELYTMNPDGSDIRQITSGKVDSKHPNWSRESLLPLDFH
jgi:TolB protein